jgi:hypothetical protein
MPSFSQILAQDQADSGVLTTVAYATASDLPLIGNSSGDIAFVGGLNRLFIWNGSGWYNIALINTNPTITTAPDAAYSFATDGTPIVLTLEAQDPEGLPITWSYVVTSGSLGSTATVAQVDNEFTITPSSAEGDIGSFSLTFTASDGVNLATATSAFTLAFYTYLTPTYTLTNPNAYSTSASDLFAWNHIAASGNYVIVGAHFEDDAGGAASGAAYIFNVTTGAFFRTLLNPNAYNTTPADYFGHTVGIDSTYAIVSAHGEDDASGLGSGKVYIFNISTGALFRTLHNPNVASTSQNDQFGFNSVAITGNYAIVGAANEEQSVNGNVTGSPGVVYIFSISTGALLFTIQDPNDYGTPGSDQFGFTVAAEGNHLIVGTPREDDDSGTESGRVYIFNVTNGTLVHTLNNPNAFNTPAGDYFGSEVAISGNYIIVGAYNEDDASGLDAGAAYIFNVTTGALVHTLLNPSGTAEWFGYSVAIAGNYATVGAPFANVGGRLYTYDVTTGALLYVMNNPNGYGDTLTYGDRFGHSAAMSGTKVIGGAPYEADASGDQSGKAYIFQIT